MGDPGERGSRALNPPEGCRSKTLVPRQRRCGWGRGWLWPNPLPRCVSEGSLAKNPRLPALGEGAPAGLPGADLRPAGESPQRPHRAFVELTPTPTPRGIEGRVFVPTTENKTRVPGA